MVSFVCEIDLRGIKKENAGNNVDPDVETRFHFLEQTVITGQKVHEKFNRQETLSALKDFILYSPPKASLNDLIKLMVKQEVFHNARLSLEEFKTLFREGALEKDFAAGFANSLTNLSRSYSKSTQPLSEEECERLRKDTNGVLLQVVEFLETKSLTSATTLFSYLSSLQRLYPGVDFRALYLNKYEETDEKGDVKMVSLREKVEKKIRDNLERISDEAYQEKFNEDKKGFVMSFMIGRVIRFDMRTKEMVFDEDQFDELMNYLDSIGHTIVRLNGETLYDMLYSESKELIKHCDKIRVRATQDEVRAEISKAGLLYKHILNKRSDDGLPKALFDKGFNVKQFYEKHIRPAVFKFYSDKLAKLKNVREVDIFDKLNDPDNQGARNYTLQMVRYVQALVATNKANPKMFMAKIRELFGMDNSPFVEDGLKQKEVKEFFSYCLAQAEKKFNSTREDAIFYRKGSDIEDACHYPAEILKCRDLDKLLEWFVYPETFKKKYVQYKDWPNDRISFSCSAFIRDFFRISKELTTEEFLAVKDKRDLVEKHLRNALKIKNEVRLKLRFRLMIQVDDTGKPFEPKKYDVVIEPGKIGQFVSKENQKKYKSFFNAPEGKVVSYEGKKYLICPIEVKDFRKVSMSVPTIPLDKETRRFESRNRVNVESLIYSGDNNLVHVKNPIERLKSGDRGKEVSDEIRWLLTFSGDGSQYDALRAFLYPSLVRGATKVEDPSESRSISKKPSGGHKRTKNSKKFKDNQVLSMAADVRLMKRIPKVLRDGKWKHEGSNLETVKVPLETQVQKLEDILIYNVSDYSETGHQSYRSERAWPLMFDQYFPPEFFGDDYKKFKDEGFKHNWRR